ncbi:uncharacterized protein [Dermacentor albipictus]|uniref:uncharacterized protein n=1 Tax=Dermacentor albipictus TaxID=60249 RepID=UPI0031FE091C
MKVLLFAFLVISTYGCFLVPPEDPDLCSFDDVKLGIILRCIRQRASVRLRNGLDHLLHVSQCQSDTCAFNKICVEAPYAAPLDVYMKPRPRREFWVIAQKCEKELPPDDETVNHTVPT